MQATAYLLVALTAYLLGSIPSGYLVARAKGVDIRTVGSGNIGATNVFRILGKPAGVFVLLLDALKGFCAVALVVYSYQVLHDLFPRIFPVAGITDAGLRENLGITAGLCAVLGHNYTCWLRFKGGKGIATTGGVYAALAPLAVGVAFGAWIFLLVLTRYVSVASLAAAVALPTAVWLTSSNLLLGIVTTALGLLAIYKHNANIRRLLSGTENRLSFKRKGTAS